MSFTKGEAQPQFVTVELTQQPTHPIDDPGYTSDTGFLNRHAQKYKRSVESHMTEYLKTCWRVTKVIAVLITVLLFAGGLLFTLNAVNGLSITINNKNILGKEMDSTTQQSTTHTTTAHTTTHSTPTLMSTITSTRPPISVYLRDGMVLPPAAVMSGRAYIAEKLTSDDPNVKSANGLIDAYKPPTSHVADDGFSIVNTVRGLIRTPLYPGTTTNFKLFVTPGLNFDIIGSHPNIDCVVTQARKIHHAWPQGNALDSKQHLGITLVCKNLLSAELDQAYSGSGIQPPNEMVLAETGILHLWRAVLTNNAHQFVDANVISSIETEVF